MTEFDSTPKPSPTLRERFDPLYLQIRQKFHGSPWTLKSTTQSGRSTPSRNFSPPPIRVRAAFKWHSQAASLDCSFTRKMIPVTPVLKLPPARESESNPSGLFLKQTRKHAEYPLPKSRRKYSLATGEIISGVISKIICRINTTIRLLPMRSVLERVAGLRACWRKCWRRVPSPFLL